MLGSGHSQLNSYGPDLQDLLGTFGIQDREGKWMWFEEVCEMMVLGNNINQDGSTTASVDHRLAQGSKCFYKHAVDLAAPDTRLKDRLVTFYRTAPVCALHGSESWAIDANCCRKLISWELTHLRSLLRIKCPPRFLTRAKWFCNKRIKLWRHQLGQLNLAQRALFSVFRWAWKVRHAGENRRAVIDHLLELQDHRPRGSWEDDYDVNVYSDPLQQHSQWRHRTRGRQRVPWEFPLYTALGPDWRTICCAASLGEWKSITKEAVGRLCELWHLSELPPKPPKNPGRPKAKPNAKPKCRAMPSKVATIPNDDEWKEHLGNEVWDAGLEGLKHVVDSQLVAGWVNGVHKCKEHFVDEVATEIYEHVEHNFGSNTFQCRGLVCEWRPRHRNLEADFACNIVLDQQASFSWRDSTTESLHSNIMFYSDGGQRETDPERPGRVRSSIGWAIRTFNISGNSKLIALGGMLMPDHMSVPELELRALLEVHRHWQKIFGNTPEEPTLRSLLITEHALPKFLKRAQESGVAGGY